MLLKKVTNIYFLIVCEKKIILHADEQFVNVTEISRHLIGNLP